MAIGGRRDVAAEPLGERDANTINKVARLISNIDNRVDDRHPGVGRRRADRPRCDRALPRRDGFATLEAGDGDQARELIEASRALVVLDVMLPGRRARALPLDPRPVRPPVIMLTARGEEADRIVGLELGADDYVTKPFSPRELAARVRTCCDAGAAAWQPSGSSSATRGRPGEPRGDEGRRAPQPDLARVRPALVPRLESAPRLLAQPPDGPRLGPHPRSTPGRSPSTSAACARSSRPTPPARAPADRVGRRLPVRPVIELALRRRRREPRCGSSSPRAAAAADRPAAARGARAPLGLRPARRGARLAAG